MAGGSVCRKAVSPARAVAEAGGLGAVLPTAGQDRAGAAWPFDERLLYGLYETDAAALRAALRVVDVTAYPLFAAVPAAAVGYAFAADVPGARAAAYRLTVSEGAALAGAMVLKHVYDRPRPYATRGDVSSRAVGTSSITSMVIVPCTVFPFSSVAV